MTTEFEITLQACRQANNTDGSPSLHDLPIDCMEIGRLETALSLSLGLLRLTKPSKHCLLHCCDFVYSLLQNRTNALDTAHLALDNELIS